MACLAFYSESFQCKLNLNIGRALFLFLASIFIENYSSIFIVSTDEKLFLVSTFNPFVFVSTFIISSYRSSCFLCLNLFPSFLFTKNFPLKSSHALPTSSGCVPRQRWNYVGIMRARIILKQESFSALRIGRELCRSDHWVIWQAG